MIFPFRRLSQSRETSELRRLFWMLPIVSATFPGLAQGVEPTLNVQSLPDGRVQISWPSTATSFLLEHSTALGTSIPWQAIGDVPQAVGDRFVWVVAPESQPRFFRLREEVPAMVSVVETSPRAGETGVSVTREAVFRFSSPLAPESILTGAGLFAEYGGRHLLARAELSGDRRSATLFLLENMPASSHVRVTLDAAGLRDATGRLIDADGDGTPGGARVLEFSTAGITGLPGTSVFGKVYASEKNPDGSNKPLENVTITVDGAEESLRTTTDATGSFELKPAPAGRFFVHIDGRTAAGSAWPGGAYYPFVGKAWSAVPGSTNNAAGGSGEVFLPLIVEGSLKEVSATEETKVTFSPAILAANPELKGVELKVPANSLFSDNGARGGKIGIVPVPPNRLPEPLPNGLNFPLVITVQTDGGSNFDRPVPVQFPNLPDPATGVKLPPGAKTALWSFNHDTGRWEVQGSMTISADGLFAVSDAGVGIRQPGWGGTNPGGQGTGPAECEGDDCDGPKCGSYPEKCCADWQTFKEPCEAKQDLALNAIKDLAADGAIFVFGATGSPSKDCGVGAGLGSMRVTRDCLKANNSKDCSSFSQDGVIGAALGCIPVVGNILGLGWGGKSVIDGYFNYSDCLKTLLAACGSTVPVHGAKPAGPTASLEHEPRLQRALDALAFQAEVSQILSNGLARVLGGNQWVHIGTPEEVEVYHGFMQAVAEAVWLAGPGGRSVTPEERAAILLLPRPQGVSVADANALIDRMEAFGTGAVGTNTALRNELIEGFDLMIPMLDTLEAKGWVTLMDGLRHALVDLASLSQPAGGYFPNRVLDYRLNDLDTGFVQRGRLSSKGQFEGMILRPNTFYSIAYFDPKNGSVGGTFFYSKGAGQTTKIPAARMFENSPESPSGVFPDQDADGLSDYAEKVLGTSETKADSDADGIQDGPEIEMGGNPLDGVGLPIGIVASSPLPGDATEVAAENNWVVVGSSEGLGVFDVANPLEPVRVAIVPGNVSAVALRGTKALVAFASGLTLLDLSVPASPKMLWILPELGAARTVGFAGSSVLAYRGSRLSRHDETTGALTGSLEISTLDSILVRGDTIYGIGPNLLSVIRNSEFLEFIRSVNAPGSGGAPDRPRRLFVAGFLYAQHSSGFNVFDISDPTAPLLIKDLTTAQIGWRQFVPTGAGRVLAVGGLRPSAPQDVSMFRFTDNGTGVEFLSTFQTPGNASSLVIASGRAFVADGLSGLTVVNFLPPDLAGIPPTVSVAVANQGTPPRVEGGQSAEIVATTQDDVGVARVEFLVNGAVVAVDDSFPFATFRVIPPVSPANPTLRVRARAFDMAGNVRESAEVVLPVVLDATPPRVLVLDPAPSSEVPPGAIDQVDLTLDQSIAMPLAPGLLTVKSAGADGILDTLDDLSLPGTVVWLEAERILRFKLEQPLITGRFRARLEPTLSDLAGNRRLLPLSWEFKTGPLPRVIEIFPPQNFVNVGNDLKEVRFVFDKPLPSSLVSNYTWELSRRGDNSFEPVKPIEVVPLPDRRTFIVRPNVPLGQGSYLIVASGPNVERVSWPFSFRNVPNEATEVTPGSGSSVQTIWKYSTASAFGDQLIVNLPGTVAPVETSDVQSLTASSDVLFRSQTVQIPTPILLNAGLSFSGSSRFIGGVSHVRGLLKITSATVELGSHVLNAYGGAILQNASLRIENSAGALFNHPGSTMTLSNLTLAGTGNSWSNSGRIVNLGTLVLQGGGALVPDVRLEDVRVRNDGRIEVARNGVKIHSLENEGVIDVAAGSRLLLPIRSVSEVSSRLTGRGSVEFGEINTTTRQVISYADAQFKGDIEEGVALKLMAGKLSVSKPLIRPAGLLEIRSAGLFQAFAPVNIGTLSLIDGDLLFNSDTVIGSLSIGARSSLRSATQVRVSGDSRIEEGFEAMGPGLVEFAGTTVVSNRNQNVFIHVGNATLRNSGIWRHAVNNAQEGVYAVLTENGRLGTGSFENTGVFEQITARPLSFQAPLRNRGRMLFKGGVVSFDARKNFVSERVGAYLPGPGADVVLQGTTFQHDFAGTLDLAAGVIRGVGTVTALAPGTASKIINRGTLQPGAPTGVITLRATGGFEQTATGELAVTLSNQGHGQLICEGTAAKLGGTLSITLADGFDPSIGATFPVVVASSLDGVFGSLALPDIGGGKKLSVEYTATRVNVRVVAN